MAGKNLWRKYKYRSVTEAQERKAAKSCVFVSHSSTNAESAREVEDYLRNDIGVNTYFDEDDPGLNNMSSNDPEKVVRHIKKGLNISTHLIVLLSDHAKLSWWVSYEYGYADALNKSMGYIKLEDINLPDFVKTQTIIETAGQLREWAKEISAQSYLENKSYDLPFITGLPL